MFSNYQHSNYLKQSNVLRYLNKAQYFTKALIVDFWIQKSYDLHMESLRFASQIPPRGGNTNTSGTLFSPLRSCSPK